MSDTASPHNKGFQADAVRSVQIAIPLRSILWQLGHCVQRRWSRCSGCRKTNGNVVEREHFYVVL